MILSKLVIKVGRLAGKTVNNARTLSPRVKSTLKTSVALYKAGYRNTIDKTLVPVKAKPVTADSILLEEVKAEIDLKDQIKKNGVYHAS
jgi:hypothetical protein